MSGCQLLVDAGNSRLKWVLLSNGTFSSGGAIFHRQKTFSAELEREWEKLDGVNSLFLSNVAGVDVAETIAAFSKRKWSVEPDAVAPQAQGYGVKSGYLEPERLGIDRWVALIASRALIKKPLCVVDCGTALTVDALDSGGNHLGGVIAPGITMMKEALLRNTSGINEADYLSEGFLGQCTADAVQLGALHSAVGLIEQMRKKLAEELEDSVKIVLTGGDAELVSQHLDGNVKLIPDLVLRGLAIIAEGKLS